MDISDDDLRELIEGVWGPSVGLPVAAVGPATDGAWSHAASLRVSGGWTGHVCIDASDGFARSLASIMFGLPESEVSADDERDALGEMANVLGGSVKTFALDEVDLALPVTADPGPRDVGPTIAEVTVAVHDHPARIAVTIDA